MARVDYDRMAPDYVRGRVLPVEGMEAWRGAIEPWVPGVRAGRSPVLDLGAGAGQFAAAIAGWFGVEVVAAFAGAGFGEEALRSVAQVRAASPAAYRDRVRLRADTGLRLLPDDQFAAGLAALDRAVAAETVPAPVVDRLDLLVVRRSG